MEQMKSETANFFLELGMPNTVCKSWKLQGLLQHYTWLFEVIKVK